MRRTLPALVVGVLFGSGLALSDMINPARVLAFLDLTDAWDPTLIYVMIGAIVPAAVAFAYGRRLTRPVMGLEFYIPTGRTLDRPLILGATIFGIGWGLAGFCPGPAIAGLALGHWQYWLFVGAMLAGMLAHRLVETNDTNLGGGPTAGGLQA